MLWFTKTDKFYLDISTVNEIVDYTTDRLNYGFSWNINRKAGSVGRDFIHPAIYPVKLIERIINLCSHEKSIVLDPFLGSGTTLIAAEKNNRYFVGYEFNEGFKPLIEYRLEKENIDPDSINFVLKENKKTIQENDIFR